MAVIDKVFKAYDIRGKYGEEIDEDLAWKVGHATAQFLRSLLSGYDRGQAASNRVVVGRDMRWHGEKLLEALVQGITSSGAECIVLGMVDTPMVYFAINHLGTCGGIQVTASHNPLDDNGFKISGHKAKPVGLTTGLNEVKHIASTLRRMPIGASMAPVRQADLWPEYRTHVQKFLQVGRPMKVVVDALNGVASKMIPALFGQTEHLEIVPENFELICRKEDKPDHKPDPLLNRNLEQTKAAVLRHGADLGICMDGDGDRCMFVDEQGQSVRCDLMTALLAPHFLADNPGAMVVYDLRSSRAVPEEIRAAGGVSRRERVGHAFMKKALADGHGVFGGELSGHFYFRDNFNCDSGAIAFATALTVLSGQPRPFSQLVAPLKRYAHSGEINFKADDKDARMKEVAEALSDAEIDYLDGVSCQYEDWWCNVRPSNTQSRLRLNMEARDETQLSEKLDVVKAILGEPLDD